MKTNSGRVWHNFGILFSILLLVIVAYFLAGIVAFKNLSCNVEQIQTLKLKDVPIVHEILNCGATTDYSTIVRIGDERVFVVRGKYDDSELLLELKDNKIYITCDSCSKEKIFKNINKFRSIKFIDDSTNNTDNNDHDDDESDSSSSE